MGSSYLSPASDLVGLQRRPLRLPGRGERLHLRQEDRGRLLLPLQPQPQERTLRRGESVVQMQLDL